MSDQITYDNKVDLQVATNIANINKVTASDMNEIKNVVNANAQEMDLNKAKVQDDIAVINNNITDLNNNKLDINAVLNQASTDTDKPYSADYLNDKLVSVGAEAPTDGRRVWFEKGKNLFDLDSAYHGTINAQGVEGSNESFRTTQFIPTTPGTTYYFSTTQISGQTNKQIYIAYYDNSKTFVSRTSYQQLSGSFTTPSNCYYMRAGVGSAWQENIMLELGSQKTTYEPYVKPAIYVDGVKIYEMS